MEPIKIKRDDTNQHSLRLRELLEKRYETDPDIIESLKQLSTFDCVGSLRSQQNLGSVIERQNQLVNETLLSSFREVRLAFDTIYENVLEIDRAMKDMRSRLHNTQLQTKELLDQTHHFQRANENNSLKVEVSEALIRTFQLTQDELNTLYGTQPKETPITQKIFDVLDHVKTIHDNCKVLLQSGQQTLAMDIIQQMTLHEESAIERVYKWLQGNLRNFDSSGGMEIVTKALSMIQSRQTLFRRLMDDYCICRRSVLVGDFIDALTRGGPSGNPSPIELKAHNPQIYITDILVWITKAVTLEKQKFEHILKECTTTGENEGKVLDQQFFSIFDDACQPLKIRIEKILAISLQPTVNYAILNLVRYYKKCIEKVLNNSRPSILSTTLDELQHQSETSFQSNLQCQINSMLAKPETPPSNLIPTPAVTKLLRTLRDMLSSASMSEGRETDTVHIARLIVDPLLCAVNEQIAHLSSVAMAVYTLNCVYALHNCLSLYALMEERLERLQAQADAQIDTLTSEQASSLVAWLQLGAIYTILQDTNSKMAPLSTVAGMEASVLQNLHCRLQQLVEAPTDILLPQLSLLSSMKYRKLVEKRAFDVIVTIYQQLYEQVHRPENLYNNPEEILSMHPEDLLKSFNKH